MKRIVTHNLPVMGNSSTVKLSIEERSIELAHYIIESKDTVRGAAKNLELVKAQYTKDVTFQNGNDKTCRGRSPRRPDSRKY